MTARMRIIVADDEPDMQEFFKEALERLGYEVVHIAGNGAELIEFAKRLKPDLVLTDIKMPDVDGLDAAAAIYEDRPVPVVVVSAHHERALIERAQEKHILAYLVKPIREAALAPAIALALHRFGEFQALQSETDDLRQALEDRKLIERAKGILMRQTGLPEADAFRRLQKLASKQNEKIVVVARAILLAAEALEMPADS